MTENAAAHHPRALNYASPRAGYVPPFYPERGKGWVATAGKLSLALLFVLTGCLILLFPAIQLLYGRRTSNFEFSATLSLGVIVIAAGVSLARRVIRVSWKRWLAWRLRPGGR